MLGLLGTPLREVFDRLFSLEPERIDLDPQRPVGVTSSDHEISLVGDKIYMDGMDTGYVLSDVPCRDLEGNALLEAIQKRIGVQ